MKKGLRRSLTKRFAIGYNGADYMAGVDARPNNLISLMRSVELKIKGPPLIVPLDIKDGQIVEDINLLGSKGKGLVEMVRLGLPVPPGFILTTTCWRDFQTHGLNFSDKLFKKIVSQFEKLEQATGLELGNPKRPLFVSVRSGAPRSMPGAMDTLLNIGINEETIGILASQIAEIPAYEAYVTLIAGMGNALRINPEKFTILKNKIKAAGSEKELKTVVQEAKDILVREKKFRFLPDTTEQLFFAIAAVFNSWNNPTAREYRKLYGISDNLGTAVVVQQMIFGNSQKKGAGTGVLFTVNPQTLDEEPTVSYIPHAQGPEVVGEKTHGQKSLTNLSEPIQSPLRQIVDKLKKNAYRYKPLELEFTTDGDKVYVLQKRAAHLSSIAQLRLALTHINNGILTEEEAMRSVLATQLKQILQPPLDPQEIEKAINEGRLIASGQRIALGHTTAPAVTSIEQAVALKDTRMILISFLNKNDLFRLPENIVGVGATNGGPGSHIGREAEKLGSRDMPFVFGLSIPPEVLSRINGKLVTLDGDFARLFEGKIPETTSIRLVSPQELDIAQEWYEKKVKNPWFYAFDLSGQSRDAFVSSVVRVQKILLEAKQHYKSPKTYEMVLLSSILPQELLFKKNIRKPDEIEEIKKLMRKAFSHGYDATIRTSHNPPLPGGGPWATVTNLADIDRLFTDPHYSKKYGGYQQMIAPIDSRVVTEIEIEETPRGKLSSDEKIIKQHYAGALSCNRFGDVIVQISPCSPQLRAIDEASADDLVTITFEARGLTEEGRVKVTTGKNLIKSNFQDEVLPQVNEFINLFSNLLVRYNIFARLAAIAKICPPPKAGVPVLEIQGRIDPLNKTNNWQKIYGLKIFN